MKMLLTMALLCPVFCYSQACDSLVKIKTDKFTDNTTYSMQSPIMVDAGATTITLWLMKFDKSTSAIATSVSSKGCTDNDQLLYFIFTDGTKHKRNNQGGFDCQGASTVYLDKKFKTLLKEKLLASVKVEAMSSSAQGDIDIEEAKRLQQVAQCMFQ